MSLRRRRAIIASILVFSAACAAWVGLSPEDPARYVAIIDTLPVPSTWEAMHTHTQRDYFFGTGADRYFLVDADPEDAVPAVKDFVRAAGFTIHTRVAPWDWCDPHPLDSNPVSCPTKVIDDCNANGLGGPRMPSAQIREVRFHDLPHQRSDGSTVTVTHQTFQIVFTLTDSTERVEHFACDIHGGLLGGIGSPAYAEFCPPPAVGG